MFSLTPYKRKRLFYSSAKGCTYLATLLGLVALFAILIFVCKDGASGLSWNLFFGDYREASPTIGPAILGTLQLLGWSLLFAFPIGVGAAVFLAEYTSTDSLPVRLIRLATETLSGIPSIVYGLFGNLCFVVSLHWGYSILAGSLTLAIMILPLIVRNVEEALNPVPNSLREGAYALGASKVRVIFTVALPSAAPGILTSLILAMGRVVSESAALLMTIGMVVGNVPETPLSPGTSLALDIYYFSSYGHQKEAAATSFVLLLFVLCIDLLAFALGKILERRKGKQ